MGVALAPMPPLGDDVALPVHREVGKLLHRTHGLLVQKTDDGPDGDAQDEVLPRRAMLARALAMGPTLSFEMMLEAVGDQRGLPLVRDEHHVAAAPTVPTIGTALGNMRLTTEGDATRTAVAGFHEYPDLVYEHLELLVTSGHLGAYTRKAPFIRGFPNHACPDL